MLYLNNLMKRYGGFVAVRNISLHVPKGDLFGFVGPNGAGKTTTIRMICGLLRPDFGNIWVDGHQQSIDPDEVKRCIGYVPDFFGVYENLKVKEYMEFYGSIYGLEGDTLKKVIGDLLSLVNLSYKEEEYVDTLSRGMKQRLCVARALLHNPDLLVMDEPSSGLDPIARVEMKELLMNLNSMGKTIIISSHILADIAEMCNSIGIMNHGRIVRAGLMKDILGEASNQHHLIIQIPGNTQAAADFIKQLPEVSIDSIRENEIVVNFSGEDEDAARIISEMMKGDIMIAGFRKEVVDLETLFVQLTGAGSPTV